MAWNRSFPINQSGYARFLLLKPTSHEIRAPMSSPNSFNPNKNSLGTNMFGLTKVDYIILIWSTSLHRDACITENQPMLPVCGVEFIFARQIR